MSINTSFNTYSVDIVRDGDIVGYSRKVYAYPDPVNEWTALVVDDAANWTANGARWKIMPNGLIHLRGKFTATGATPTNTVFKIPSEWNMTTDNTDGGVSWPAILTQGASRIFCELFFDSTNSLGKVVGPSVVQNDAILVNTIVLPVL